MRTHEPERANEVDYDDDGDTKSGFLVDYVAPGEDEMTQFGEANFGTIASPHLSPYVRGSRLIDTVYGIRRDADGTIIRNSSVTGREQRRDCARGHVRGHRGFVGASYQDECQSIPRHGRWYEDI